MRQRKPLKEEEREFMEMAQKKKAFELRMLSLKGMWEEIDCRKMSSSKKRNCFVAINVLLWTFIPLVSCLLAGLAAGNFGETWAFITFLVIGYSAVVLGFFRSVIYLLRR